MIHYKKPAIIGESEIISLFDMFGFEIFNIDTHSLDEIISILSESIDMYAMIIISSTVSIHEKQRRKLDQLHIPLSQLPLKATDTGVDELKKLTEKAVGMNLDTLFTS